MADSIHLAPFRTSPEKRTSISGHTASDQSFQTVSSWIRHCTMNHPMCGPGAAGPLPTRILDLQAGDLDREYVRLCITRNELERYACLSYCWGNPDTIMKTTESTLEDHCKGMRVSLLPATFRDAITFV